ncbi:RNA-directed DNA polymerase, eukaryota, Reverse transcriptase zinc-binding domain protein [Artemisia annua]|uniref:RNA-directed DNA polymerase, eukaryota, Reverse transcriptase zinc-binding domain protein n=1 Tax=Artemisia annua TaxID=35608 RepID=A0A2U1Q490_ARTAN|nr:RNA-directed DNA polymerase, eukaryota, Reverse transcriptase zinc-binding domain protein [Artemisia annua]
MGGLANYYFSLYRARNLFYRHSNPYEIFFSWVIGGARNIHWVVSKKVLFKKEYGGLGIGTLEATNFALLIKWWWRFKSDEEGIWKKVIKGFHGKEGGLNCAENSHFKKVVCFRRDKEATFCSKLTNSLAGNLQDINWRRMTSGGREKAEYAALTLEVLDFQLTNVPIVAYVRF